MPWRSSTHLTCGAASDIEVRRCLPHPEHPDVWWQKAVEALEHTPCIYLLLVGVELHHLPCSSSGSRSREAAVGHEGQQRFMQAYCRLAQQPAVW
jgi:hypothetical protein